MIWLDEESPYDLYVECLLRTMVVNGQVLLTATPLLGMSDIMRFFIQPAEGDQSKFYVQATWDDVPHLDTASKQALLASIPHYQREARSKGVPQLGAGAIYHWRKTACIFGARDNESGVVYLYSEHYAGLQQPSLHAQAIQSRGDWLRGVIDPAAQGRTQTDGEKLIELYRSEGLNLQPAVNAVEAGLYTVWQMMSSGKLKVFASMANWRQEFRLYARDKDGKVIKQHDHAMDAMRYFIVSGLSLTQTKPSAGPDFDPLAGRHHIPADVRWMM